MGCSKTEVKEVKKVYAEYDQIIGKCHHFTIGEVGDVISGGIYIMLPAEIPEKITLVFRKKKE